jgi:hypothetical protein
MVCAVPIVLMPIAGRSSFELAREQAAFNARFNAPVVPARWKTADVRISRDPFVPEHSVLPHEDEQTASVTSTANAAFEAAVVRAVVTAPARRALVDENGSVRIVAVGDSVAGSPVVAIERSGIRLQSGQVLRLTGDAP